MYFLNVLNGTGSFVDAFNFGFSLMCNFLVIGLVPALCIKLISRS